MNPVDHSYWLASRAIGIVALALLSISVAWGLSMSSKLAKRGPGSIGRAKQFHEALSLVALSAILAHGLILLGDNYINPTFSQLFIPFTMPKQPIWTGIGIIGGWVAMVCGLSYYARRWIGANRWKVVHRFTLLAWLFAFAHGIGSGSDASTGWFLALMGILLVPVFFALAYRLLPGDEAKPPSSSKRDDVSRAADRRTRATAKRAPARSGTARRKPARRGTPGPAPNPPPARAES